MEQNVVDLEPSSFDITFALAKARAAKALKVFHSSLWNIVQNSSIHLDPFQK
jgi:hypothetical protein